MNKRTKSFVSALVIKLVVLTGCTSASEELTTASAPGEWEARAIESAFPQTTSVIIERNGSIVLERYYRGGGRNVLNNTRSATKSITALAVGAAIADGAIPSVDARAFDYLGDLAPWKYDNEAKRAITLHDLLTMSSALACDDSDPKSPGNEENMYPLAQWAQWAADLPTDEALAGSWRYCTAGTVLLGHIIQKAVNESVDGYIGRRILAPLGITRFKWFYSGTGEVLTGGGLELRSLDLAKIARMVLARGVWEGEQIVPAKFMGQALTLQKTVNEDQDYGYLFWNRDFKTRCGSSGGWYMAGNGGNAIVMFRDLNALIVVTRTRYNTPGMHQETIRLIEDHALPAIVCSQDPG